MKTIKINQKKLAIWAAECAVRVLPLFEKKYPEDERPRKALLELGKWIKTGIFSMEKIRRASLDSHAAARKAKSEPAKFAARACGQAVATAHVAEHAYGSSYYALKAIGAMHPENPKEHILREYKWQFGRMPKILRKDWLIW
ncbi:MAG: putative immunity protein, partial [Candidatus Micrarchaeota archaeon]